MPLQEIRDNFNFFGNRALVRNETIMKILLGVYSRTGYHKGPDNIFISEFKGEKL